MFYTKVAISVTHYMPLLTELRLIRDYKHSAPSGAERKVLMKVNTTGLER